MSKNPGKKKISLDDIETTIAVLSAMPEEGRVNFAREVDQMKQLHGKELEERLSKAAWAEFVLVAY